MQDCPEAYALTYLTLQNGSQTLEASKAYCRQV
jgi:hypothetical protein